MTRWAACLSYLTFACVACGDSYLPNEQGDRDSGASPDSGALNVPADSGRSIDASDAGAHDVAVDAAVNLACVLTMVPSLDVESRNSVTITIQPVNIQLEMQEPVTYHGPVTVNWVDGSSAELMTGSGVRIRWSNIVGPLAEGDELWAEIDETLERRYAFRRSEAGALLAEYRDGELVDDGAESFLGVPITFEPLCTMESECAGMDILEATIHGDRELTLTGNRFDYVEVGGIEYKVWLKYASAVRLYSDPDCPPPPKLGKAPAIQTGTRLGISARLSTEADHRSPDDDRDAGFDSVPAP